MTREDYTKWLSTKALLEAVCFREIQNIESIRQLSKIDSKAYYNRSVECLDHDGLQVEVFANQSANRYTVHVAMMMALRGIIAGCQLSDKNVNEYTLAEDGSEFIEWFKSQFKQETGEDVDAFVEDARYEKEILAERGKMVTAGKTTAELAEEYKKREIDDFANESQVLWDMIKLNLFDEDKNEEDDEDEDD